MEIPRPDEPEEAEEPDEPVDEKEREEKALSGRVGCSIEIFLLPTNVVFILLLLEQLRIAPTNDQLCESIATVLSVLGSRPLYPRCHVVFASLGTTLDHPQHW